MKYITHRNRFLSLVVICIGGWIEWRPEWWLATLSRWYTAHACASSGLLEALWSFLFSYLLCHSFYILLALFYENGWRFPEINSWRRGMREKRGTIPDKLLMKTLSFWQISPHSCNNGHKEGLSLQWNLLINGLCNPCGGGLEYLHCSSASRKRRPKGNPVPGGITGPPCSWGI
jgi:hypothetical protein